MESVSKSITRGAKCLLIGALLPIFGAGVGAAEELRVGWLGALTGPVAKYGAAQAALIAQDEINAAGGINGRKLRLVQEDGQCKGIGAVTAFRKLVTVDKVKFILGGHCSPESMAIAPLCEKHGVLCVASITSSTKLTGLSRNLLRLSPVSSIVGVLTAQYSLRQGQSRAAVINEETDYVIPAAEAFAQTFTQGGGVVVKSFNFSSGESDFRSMLTKIRASGVDSIYIGAQSAESAELILEQLQQVGLRASVYGNEQVGHIPTVGDVPEITFAEPAFDPSEEKTQRFIQAWRAKTGEADLPLGIWTAEAYDAVHLLAAAIAERGEVVEGVRKKLLSTSRYLGASGEVSIGSNGDGIRKYYLKLRAPDGGIKVIQ